MEKAIKLKPECARCVFLYGVVRFNQGQIAQSESAFRRAVLLNPDNSRFRTHLAALLMRSGQTDEASRQLRQAIVLPPQYGLPHYELGRLLASRSLKQAAVELEDARRFDPKLTQALYQLGQVYLKLGKREKAQQALREFRETKSKQEEQAAVREDLELALIH